MNYNVKMLENYYSDQAHKLARHPHTMIEDWIETFRFINMHFELLREMI